MITKEDLKFVTNIQVTNIDLKDYPDFCDAYIDYAEIHGRPCTEEELDSLNDDHYNIINELAHQEMYAAGERKYDQLKDQGFYEKT